MAKTEKPKVKPLPFRQQKLAKLIAENRGNKKSDGELMREAGYSEVYSKNPRQLKRTETWQSIMDKQLPESLVARRHKQLLNKKETFVDEVVDERGRKKKQIVRSKEIHVPAVTKGVELAYRLRGKLTDRVGLDIESTKIDQALARLRKIIPESKS